MSVKTLLADYKKSCDAIVQTFCKKQGIEFEFWVDDKTCDIVQIGDCFLNLSDIIIDLSELSPKGKILDWYYDSVERHFESKQNTSYLSYVKNNYNFFD